MRDVRYWRSDVGSSDPASCVGARCWLLLVGPGLEAGGYRGGVCVVLCLFQAEDGIRYIGVTGVQTCALPILTTAGLLAAVPDGKLCLLGDSGHVKWEEKFYPLYVDERHDVVIVYRSIMTGKLRGLRLSTSEELWTTSVLHQKNWGWDDFKLVSDSMLMVAADNIYFVNINNGHTIKYDASMGHVDTGAVLGQVLGGIAMGMTFGVFITANYGA